MKEHTFIGKACFIFFKIINAFTLLLENPKDFIENLKREENFTILGYSKDI